MVEAASSTARGRLFTPRSSPAPCRGSSRIPAPSGGGRMPISITRVYTRTGDRGDTALVGGRRVPKDSPRIVAYGTLDELNAAVGLARVFNAERLAVRGPARERHRWLDEVLRRIQNQLFDLGSELATPADAAYDGMFRIGEGEVRELEQLMDHC